MMGVGKSTLGKIAAKKQGLKFIDTDLNIEKRCSMKITEIFKKKGEDFFRLQEEKEVLESLKKSKCIIALGGGAFINKSIRDVILKNSIFLGILSSYPPIMLSTPITLCFISANFSAKCEPRNPATPVTKIFLGDLFIRDYLYL